MKIPKYISEIRIPPALQDTGGAGIPWAAQIRAEDARQRSNMAFQQAGQEISEQVSRYVKHEDFREEKRREAQQAIEHIDRTVAITGGIADMAQQYGADPNYDGKVERWQQDARKYVDDQLQQIKDPLVARIVKVDVEKQLMHHTLEVKQSAAKQRGNESQAIFEASMDRQSQLEATAPDPISLQRLTDTRKQMLANAVKTGIIHPTQAQAKDAQMDDNLIEGIVKRDMRVDPQETLNRLSAGQYDLKDARRREGIIGMVQREIERRDQRADMELRRQVTSAERAERQEERALRESQKANFGRLAAGQTNGKTSQEDIDRAVQNRQIDPEHYRQLLDRQRRDIEKEINEGEQYLDQTFRTKGPLEALDPVNEQYRAQLKRELRERSRGGELPTRVADDILHREQKTPKAPNAYPTPMFLQGDKTDLGALDRAAQATAEKYRQGLIDESTARREKYNIEKLQESVRYQNQMKENKTDKDKKSGKSSGYMK